MSADEVTDYLAECTLEGKWEKVIRMYNQFPSCHTAMINESVGTALHCTWRWIWPKKSVVQELVEAVITWQQQSATRIKALEIGNERGDTPLHVAASRGVARICKWIIGANNERIYLVSRKNKHGETPLFQAANWHREAFAYLSHIWGNSAPLQDLVRDNGDTILHCAIRRGYYDLAVIIVHYYDFLSTHTNDEGFTPLKVLATKPSAFKSTTKLSWWRRILYHCIVVEPLDPERQMKANLAKMEEHPDKVPKNYATLYDFFAGSLSVAAQIGKMLWKKNHDTENPPINKQCTIGFLPPNYETFQQFLRSAYVHILGVSGYIKRIVPRHFGYIRGKNGKTPWEVFKETHVALRRESSDWLKETSESCSVVAALVAGVSFATANAIPGGADDKGLPHLEGKPAFHAFVIASLIGLCFSVTGLIMFLTILTSRKLHRDFGRSLPLKLLLGLSSLFLAIVAMLVSFCTGHSFLLSQKYKKVIFPFYVATCFPVTFYAASQLPLYFDLLATIFVMVPLATDEGDSL